MPNEIGLKPEYRNLYDVLMRMLEERRQTPNYQELLRQYGVGSGRAVKAQKEYEEEVGKEQTRTLANLLQAQLGRGQQQQDIAEQRGFQERLTRAEWAAREQQQRVAEQAALERMRLQRQWQQEDIEEAQRGARRTGLTSALTSVLGGGLAGALGAIPGLEGRGRLGQALTGALIGVPGAAYLGTAIPTAREYTRLRREELR